MASSTMSFSFNFGGDDIDTSLDADGSTHLPTANGAAQHGMEVEPAEVKAHNLQEWLANLPSRISYTTTTIESPTGKLLHLPRRELFDVRSQLMAEDDDATLADLDKSDIRTNIYEGGFKTWECSLDLASLLLDRGPRKDIDELSRVDCVVELGAGTAMPSMVLFQHALQSAYPITFTLADYNASVLRLVTLPNLLLAFARFGAAPTIEATGSGDLEITPEFVESFLAALRDGGIEINLLSGPWSPELASLIPASGPDMGTVILAAETIYSPQSTTAFVDLTMNLLKRVKMSKAMVAAKRIYFGVGGSVDALKEACNERGAVAYEIENHGVPGMDEGVGRALIEVQMY